MSNYAWEQLQKLVENPTTDDVKIKVFSSTGDTKFLNITIQELIAIQAIIALRGNNEA